MIEPLQNSGKPMPMLQHTALGNYWLEELHEETDVHWMYRGHALAGPPMPVWVKVLQPNFSNNPAFCKHLQNLVRYQRSFKTEHLLPLLAAQQQPPYFYYVTPHVSSITLADQLRSKPISHWVAVRILQQLATAVAALHRQGLYHLEIRPSNIWIDQQNNAFLGEAGLWAARRAAQQHSRQAQHATQPTSAKAQLQYLAPEQLNTQPFDERTDLYALGVVFFEMLCGQPPYPAESARMLALAQFSQPLPMHLLHDNGLLWQPILAKLLAFDRRSRFDSVAQLLQAIRDHLAGQVFKQTQESASESESLSLTLQQFGYQSESRVVSQSEVDQAIQFLQKIKPKHGVKVSSMALGAVGLALAGVLGAGSIKASPHLTPHTKTATKQRMAAVKEEAARQQLITLINEYRQATGLTQLSQNTDLQTIAQQRAADMLARHYFDHNDPRSGETLVFALGDAAGFRQALGENLGRTNANLSLLPVELMNAWQASPTHHANLAGAAYNQLGLSLMYDQQQQAWIVVLVLAGPAAIAQAH